jgi:parvulin-like peptidyl-prolyl isomerase
MSAEYQILSVYAGVFVAIMIAAFAAVKLSKAKKKPKLAQGLLDHWFPAFAAVAFVAMVHLFAREMTKDLFKDLLPSKQVGGQDIVFEVGGKDITTDEFYDELYSYYGDYAIYVNLKRAIIDLSVPTTDEIKASIAAKKTETVSYWQELAAAYAQYGYTYESIAKYFLSQYDYFSVNDLDKFITEMVKTDEMNFAYLDENMDDFFPAFQTSKKPRVVAHILIAMDDPTKPTEAEAARLQAVKDALAGGMSFEDAAKEYSEDSQTNQDNGLLGYMDKDTSYQTNFLNAALALEEGQTSAWITTSFGYHLIKMMPSGLDDLTDYDEFYYALLGSNTGMSNKILWANALKLNIDFGGNAELEAAIKKYMGVEDEE